MLCLKKAAVLILGCATIVMAGCGAVSAPGLPDLVPVFGTVLIDGKPLPDAVVTFVPAMNSSKGMGQGASAVTDESGAFELVTAIGKRPKPGAIPGKYRVLISRLIGPDGSPITLEPDAPPAHAGARESLPPRFSDVMLSELKADVSDEGGTFDFKVKPR